VFLTLVLDNKELEISPELIHLKELIETIYNETFKLNYEKKGLYFKIETESDIPIIQSDKHYLTIVFQKILDNAEKYTDTGGVTISLQREDNYAIVKIEDTGKGFTEGEKNLIFEKFFHGSLGLYNVKSIIDVLNGKISAESAGLNKGAKFIIKLSL
jgi:two-component system phosphate regulon sensor histidine kinase PhoR